jgi:hypothetical protein
VTDYNKAIQLNKFQPILKMKTWFLNFEGIVQGEVKEITTKPHNQRKVEVHKQNKRCFGFGWWWFD